MWLQENFKLTFAAHVIVLSVITALVALMSRGIVHKAEGDHLSSVTLTSSPTALPPPCSLLLAPLACFLLKPPGSLQPQNLCLCCSLCLIALPEVAACSLLPLLQAFLKIHFLS